MKFAEHVGTPAVVVVEDIEKVIEADPRKMDKLLEIFDGMRTKGREVALLLTTNHAEKLPASLMRAGRINRMIYVSDLDADALRRLIDRKIPAEQREELDYQVLQDKFEGFKPSWVVQVLDDAVIASVIRTGKTGEPLVTDDFVQEALALRPQFDLHRAATEVKETPELEDVIGKLVTQRVNTALQNHMVDLGDGEIMVRS
jgi:transitional endoplasmic reticulum ATPase